MPDERLGRLGAPPVELRPALPPVAAVPLADHRGDPTVGRRLVLAPQRQLPADLGLELDVADPPGLGLEVQRAARAGGEPGAVEEDAGAVDQTGAEVAVGQLLDDALLALGVELPDARGRASVAAAATASASLRPVKWAP